MSELFISHVSEDRAIALQIVSALERRGISCWIAPRDVRAGKPFDNEIADAIDACTALLLIFPDKCNDNEYIRREITAAGNSGKPIIPLRIEEAQPKRGLNVRLGDLHWIDAFVDLEDAIDQVLRSLQPKVSQNQAEPTGKASNITALQTPVHVRDVADLPGVRSNSNVIMDFSSGIVGRAFPSLGPHAKWKNVHDGKELILGGLRNFQLTGHHTELLAEPRYAWVLNFQDCHSVSLREIVLGHSKAGYCRGGVIRFESCTNIFVEKCDLFGCGTYGVEFVNCKTVEIAESTIRNCTYGIANFLNSSHINFTNCKFHENEGFDLFNIRGAADGFKIKRCSFHKNRSQGAMFHFDEARTPMEFHVDDSTFSENVYTKLTNEEIWLSQSGNDFSKDQILGAS